MSLIIQAPNWTYWNSTWPTTPTNSNQGTAFTCGTNDTKGSTTSLFTVAADCELLRIFVGGGSVSTAAAQMLVDVMIDPAGGTSWATDPLVPNLVMGGHGHLNISGGPAGIYTIPIFIPSGAAIGVRGAWGSGSAPASTLCVAEVYGGNTNPGSWWCGQSVVAYGVNTATTDGTSVTPGASSAWGSWTNVGSVTETDHMCFFASVQTNQAATSAFGYEGQIGYASTQIGNTFAWSNTISEQSGPTPVQLIYHPVPAGTQLQARMSASGAGQAQAIAIYGIS